MAKIRLTYAQEDVLLDIFCNYSDGLIPWDDFLLYHGKPRLRLIAKGLLARTDEGFRLTDAGRAEAAKLAQRK